MSYATFEDVQNRWWEDLSDARTVIETRLDDAELVIKTRIPDLEARVEAGTLSEKNVVLVEAEALLRIVRNPEGYMQESDGGYSYMLNQKIANGDLDIMPREWRWLGLSGGAFVIRPLVSTGCSAEGAIDPYATDPTWR